MTQRRSPRRPELPASLGPFVYAFRPSPAGEHGTILIRASEDAPAPARGDVLILTTDDCLDADFEVTEVIRKASGWWAGCERRRPA